MSRIRCAVFGAGRIGRVHGRNLARNVDGAELVGIADIDRAAAEELAGTLGVPVFTTDYTELLHRDDVDAVVVCTPTSTHYEVLTAAISAGKAIFTEKPIDLDLTRIDTINAAVSARGIPFMVGFQRRYDPDFQRLHDLVRNGSLGDVHVVRITSRDAVLPPESFIPSSGGLFLDMTIHDLDMARFMTASEVTGVFAKGAVLVDPMFARHGDWDTAVVTLTMASGALVAIDNSRRAVYGQDQRVEVFGSAGMASADNHAVDRVTWADAGGGHSARLQDFFPERYRDAYRLELQAFVDAVRDGRPIPVTGADGRQAVAIGLAVLTSARENRFVSVG